MQIPSKLELWGGVEGTINRVQDRYFDQLQRNGHRNRSGDIEKFAELGIKKMRYPLLWESIAPESEEQLEDEKRWEWIDRKIEEFKLYNVKPIAGLIHHGSGPRYTSLIDPEFPQKLAHYAKKFSERYPWIDDYIPVNEPLTTARFSGLYGIWYPHGKDERIFLRCLYHEVQGIILSMREIWKVNPQARLIITDDLGRATATERMQYQADFENERRWLSFDLLTGKIDSKHPFHQYFLDRGFTESELEWMLKNATQPDLIGINHYPLSNRFIDHRTELYPKEHIGGNGRDSYADVGAIDVKFARPPSPASIFMEAWERYRIPIAVTEVHTLGGREHQLRWFQKVWNSALEIEQKGADIRAVTVWSLLGAYDWNSLCAKEVGFYEPGAFDLRAKRPRITAIAQAVRAIAHSEHKGRIEDRFERLKDLNTRPILITGANGTLGKAFARICTQRALFHEAVNRSQMDITNDVDVAAVIAALKPWAVINAAGYVKLDEAEQEPDRCFRENVLGPEVLARVCAQKGIPLLTFSSDMVFSGDASQAYVESSSVSPCNVYGRSKAESERRVLNIHPKALVVRTSSFFGPWDEHNFIYTLLKSISSKVSFKVPHDLRISPTYVPELVHTCLDLLIDGEVGLVHLTNQGEVSWADLAFAAAKTAKSTPHLGTFEWDHQYIEPIHFHEMGYKALRPKYSALSSERVTILSSFDQALNRYFEESRFNWGVQQ